MLKKIHFRIFWLNVLLVYGCADRFNTAVGPQASPSILASKKDGFYLLTAKKIHTGVADCADSVWLEKVWRYELQDGARKKVPLSANNQIVLKLKNTHDDFKKSTYFLKWRIEVKHHGDLASGNEVFMLRYPKDTKIDTVQFMLHKIPGDSIMEIGTFLF